MPRTTVVCCLVQQGQIHWAHAGDSRFYLVRKGRLLTRTRDHSKIENLLQQERVLPMDVANHPERNKLYNCLGSPNLPLIDIGGPVRLDPGDVAQPRDLAVLPRLHNDVAELLLAGEPPLGVEGKLKVEAGHGGRGADHARRRLDVLRLDFAHHIAR